jgi:alpha-galactosidase
MGRELQAAGRLGVDVLQIDDGWQKGATVNSKLKKGGVWEGYYAADPDFWQVNEAKFPQGLAPLARDAQRLGIKLGLWFSPDSSDDFVNWQRDADTLLRLHAQCGVSYFKLDGVNIKSKRAETNFIRLLERVSRQGGNEIGLNLDITAQDRLGYLYQSQFGTLYVENRYTDWANYYPHNTLKNAWSLSRYFPLNKFQFEVPNNERNAHLYADDPLAPARYTIDYAFASVMAANPLIWMEMTNLSEDGAERLRGIIGAYKPHRENLFAARVSPLGDMPDGQSFTGFQAACDEQSGYLILLRENTADCRFAYRLACTPGKTIETQLLYTNAAPGGIAAWSAPDGGALSVRMDAQRTYGFFKYRLAD